jgi:phage protein D
MALPVATQVLLWVKGTAVVDITDDLLEFTFTEEFSAKASTVDIKLRDTDLKYRNRLFIKKGTKIAASFRVLNGNNSPPRGTGDMWVDTVEMELKPRTVTFKATSIDPALEKGGKKHKGTEGKNVNAITAANVTPTEGTTAFLGNPSEDPTADPKQKRADQENESDLEYAERKAKEAGKVVVVRDGKIYSYRMADVEAANPLYTISDGTSNLLSGKLKTTNQGKFKKGKIKYHDPKTGKLLTKEVEVALDDATNEVPPAAVLNSRKRPNFIGPTDDPDPDPEVPIGKGQPGDSGD